MYDITRAFATSSGSLRAACSRRAPTGIRNRALLAVLFRSGLRIFEALALFPKDLDLAGGSLRVLHGKGDKARTAPLPSDAAEAVDRWLDCRKPRAHRPSPAPGEKTLLSRPRSIPGAR